MTNNNDELKNLIESNARAIEALAEYNAEALRERARFYRAMSDLAAVQSATYNRVAEQDEALIQLVRNQTQLNRRQGEIVEILRLLANREGQG